MREVKPCPFCGDEPKVSTEGTFIDIDCCVSMSRQKSDYLGHAERSEWNAETHRYGADAERKALNAVLSEWNSRAEN